MSVWRKQYITALIDKDPEQLDAVFKQHKDQASAVIILDEQEKELIASSWVERDFVNLPTDRKRRLIVKLVEGLPNSLFACCQSTSPKLARIIFSHASPEHFDVPDEHGRNPLFYAAFINDRRIAYKMTSLMIQRIKQSSNPNLLSKLLNQVDNKGFTILQRICYQGNWHVTELLLSEGAQVNRNSVFAAHPLVSACNNRPHPRTGEKPKTDDDIITGINLLLGFNNQVDFQEGRMQTPLHLACDQYAEGWLGSKVVFHLMEIGLFSLLTQKNQHGRLPLSYIRDHEKLEQFETEMKAHNPMLYLEYALAYKPIAEVHTWISQCMSLKNRRQQILEHLHKFLLCEGYNNQLNSQLRNSVLYSITQLVIGSNAFNGKQDIEFKTELVNSVLGCTPLFFMDDKTQAQYQALIAERDELMLASASASDGQSPSAQSQQRISELRTEIEMLERIPTTKKYHNVVMLCLTIPGSLEVDTIIKQAFNFLISKRDGLEYADVKALYDSHQEAFSKQLLMCFNEMVTRRHGQQRHYSAQKAIDEIDNLKQQNNIFKPFMPGLAYAFAQDYYRSVKVLTDVNGSVDANDQFAKLKVVYGALLEATEIPEACQMLKQIAGMIVDHPLTDVDYRRIVRQSIRGYEDATPATPSSAQIMAKIDRRQKAANGIGQPNSVVAAVTMNQLSEESGPHQSVNLRKQTPDIEPKSSEYQFM